MILILSGNPNLGTIRNVIYFVNNYFDQQINKICFVDSNETLNDREGKSLESERNNIVRRYIGSKIAIESQVIEKNDLHIDIPKMLSNHLKIYGEDNIVIDLTNGTKYISNVLYASASLSKIKNLFFL
jgi:hypothetical protein